jgi:uncharacterized protein YqjF (DUF2071 family)
MSGTNAPDALLVQRGHMPLILRSPGQPGVSELSFGHPVVGWQQWRDLLFLHWRVSPASVQASLPPGLAVDTFDGEAWLGIVPFAMRRVRPRFLPPVPWLSWFLELNVRTYVRDAQGVPGVWFYSLDCDQPVAVEIARRFFHLPYMHARMQAARTANSMDYVCQRRGAAGTPWRYTWETVSDGQPAAGQTLEHFLVERYVLYCADARQRLYRGRVSHTPYRIHVPTVLSYDAGPARLAGFSLHGEPASLLAAEPVNVAIHSLKRLSPD